MSLETIYYIGQTIAVAAILGSLIFVGVQIRQNTLATRRQSLDGVIDRIVRWQSRLTSTPTHVDSWVKGLQNFDSLPVEEKIHFNALIIEILVTLEAGREAGKTGDIKPETIEAMDGMIVQLFRNAGVREYWRQANYAADFMAYVDKITEKVTAIPNSDPGSLPFYVPPEEATQ